MKPNLLIAGCGKCGTTTLAYLLDQHPQIYISKPKETNFLSHENIFEKGWEWYESKFLPGKDFKILGEASVSYTTKEYENIVRDRIKEHLKDIKVIYIARNPIKRLESVFMEHHDSGYKNGWLMPYNLQEAAKYRPEMLRNSLYWERTEYLRQILPEENILYLCLEDLANAPQNLLDNCYKFLCVEPFKIKTTATIQRNKSSMKSYDSKFLRFLKKRKTFFNLQPEFLIKLENNFLRNSFGNSTIHWDRDFKEYFVNFMKKDVSMYLKQVNKPSDFWGREYT